MITPSDLPLNKGLLDARSTGRTLSSLRQQFYPVEFFDLCTIIEEIVLRDEVVLVGKFDMLNKNYVAALQPFINAGVFRICLESMPIVKTQVTNPQLRGLARVASEKGLTATSIDDADFAVTRLLGAETSLRVPTTPLLQHLHNYQYVRRPMLDNTVCDLTSRYSSLKDRLFQLKAMDFRRLALKPIYLPPIALRVIQTSHSYDKLTEQILGFRNDFAFLRLEMNRLASILADPTLSSDKFFQLTERWEYRWQRATESDRPILMQIGQTAVPLLQGGVELARSYSSGSVRAGLQAGLDIMRHVNRLNGMLTFRPVHLSVRNYMTANPHQMIRAVSRLFEANPNWVKRQMDAIGGVNSSVWHAAFRDLK